MAFAQELRSLLQKRVVQLGALPCLLATLSWISFANRYSVKDPDLWWHLKVGDWIVTNVSVPHTGVFSRTAGEKPWVAYSWGYEVLLSLAHRWFGLFGLACFNMLVTIAVALTILWVLHRLSGRFWIAWALTLVGSYGFLYSLLPRPVFFTMMFYAVELTLLLEAQRAGSAKSLYWLIPLFAVWANVHIQFIYGLAVLGLFVGLQAIEQIVDRLRLRIAWLEYRPLPLSRSFVILFASGVVTCIGPYGYHLYRVLIEYSHSHVPYTIIMELQALQFRVASHYVLLFLVAAGFYAVGWRTRLDLFKFALLIVSSVIAFRTSRDAWFVCITAIAFIADRPNVEGPAERLFRWQEAIAVAIASLFLVTLLARNYDFNTRGLDLAISDTYPVDAANFIRKAQLSGPLYNQLNWGGFLIWYLPQYPVAIDGRNDLYGDEMDARAFKTEQGDYRFDPYLKNANLVILPTETSLALLLMNNPQFRLVYQDQIASVFVRQ